MAYIRKWERDGSWTYLQNPIHNFNTEKHQRYVKSLTVLVQILRHRTMNECMNVHLVSTGLEYRWAECNIKKTE